MVVIFCNGYNQTLFYYLDYILERSITNRSLLAIDEQLYYIQNDLQV